MNTEEVYFQVVVRPKDGSRVRVYEVLSLGIGY